MRNAERLRNTRGGRLRFRTLRPCAVHLWIHRPAAAAMALPGRPRQRGVTPRAPVRTAGARNDTHGTGSTQMSAIDDVIAAFAARQHGLITRPQLLAARIAPDTVRSRVRR